MALWTPFDDDDLATWHSAYDAGDVVLDGVLVDQMTGLSPGAHHAVSSGSSRPTWDATGWDGTLPSVAFDGIDDRFYFPTPTGQRANDPKHILVLYQANNVAAYADYTEGTRNSGIGADNISKGYLLRADTGLLITHLEGGAYMRDPAVSRTPGTPRLVDFVVGANGSSAAIYLNGEEVVATTDTIGPAATEAEPSYTTIGLQGGTGWSGSKIIERVAFNGVPTLEQLQIRQGYAAHRINRADLLPADHPYKDAPPTVLDAPPEASISAAVNGQVVTLTVDSIDVGATATLTAATGNGADILGDVAGSGPWFYGAPETAEKTDLLFTFTISKAGQLDATVEVPAIVWPFVWQRVLSEDFTGDYGAGPGNVVITSPSVGTYGDWTLAGLYDETPAARIGGGTLQIPEMDPPSGSTADLIYDAQEFPAGAEIEAVIDIARVGVFSTGEFGGQAFSIGLHAQDDGVQPVGTGSAGSDMKVHSGYYANWQHGNYGDGWNLDLLRTPVGGGSTTFLARVPFAAKKTATEFAAPQLRFRSDGNSDGPSFILQALDDGEVLAEIEYTDDSPDRLPTGGYLSLYVSNSWAGDEKSIDALTVWAGFMPLPPILEAGDLTDASVAELQIAAWLTARDLDTGDVNAVGVWTGPHAMRVEIDGAMRTYERGGYLLGVDMPAAQYGAMVDQAEIELAYAGPVMDLLRNNDPTLAAVELHLLTINPRTQELAAIRQVFLGQIDEVALSEGATGVGQNGTVSVTLKVPSAMRDLEESLPYTWSGPSQETLWPGANDQLLQYTTLTDQPLIGQGEPIHKVPGTI
jgi:hypothetical protein